MPDSDLERSDESTFPFGEVLLEIPTASKECDSQKTRKDRLGETLHGAISFTPTNIRSLTVGRTEPSRTHDVVVQTERV